MPRFATTLDANHNRNLKLIIPRLACLSSTQFPRMNVTRGPPLNRLKLAINNPRTFVTRLLYVTSGNFLTISGLVRKFRPRSPTHSLVIVPEELEAASFVPFRLGSADERLGHYAKRVSPFGVRYEVTVRRSRARWKIVRRQPTLPSVFANFYTDVQSLLRAFSIVSACFHCWITLAVHGVCLKCSSSLEYRENGTSISNISSLILAATRAFHFQPCVPRLTRFFA